MKTIKLLLLLTILSSFSFPSKEVKLEYTFTTGDQYVWTLVTNQTMQQNFLGNEQVIESSVIGSLLLKVQSLTSTGARIEATYIELAMTMKLPAGMQAITIDSKGDQAKTENKVMKSIMNKPFTILLSKQGIIEDVEGIDNLWSGLSELGIDEQQQKTLKQQFEQNFGKNSIKSLFEMAFTSYPDKKVTVGTPWKNTTGVGLNFPLQTENIWLVTSVVKEMANLTADGSVKTPDKEQIINLPNNLKAKMDLEGTQKINSVVHVKTGWPSEVKISSDLNGNMNLLAGGMIPADMQVPMKIVSQSLYSFVKK